MVPLDEDWKTNDDFWKVFGGKDKVSVIKSAAAGGHDENYWRENRQQITLWKYANSDGVQQYWLSRVSDASGTLKVTKVSQGGLDTKSLDTKVPGLPLVHLRKLTLQDAFIVDANAGGLYVWVGKGCTMAERKKAMDWGQQYLKQQVPSLQRVIGLHLSL